MKIGRPFNASTQYKMIVHTNGKHRYASTKTYIIDEGGVKRYTYKHWGTHDAHNRFRPGIAYLYATIEERQQLIFPKNWDLSEIEALSGTKRRDRITYEAQEVILDYGRKAYDCAVRNHDKAMIDTKFISSMKKSAYY